MRTGAIVVGAAFLFAACSGGGGAADAGAGTGGTGAAAGTGGTAGDTGTSGSGGSTASGGTGGAAGGSSGRGGSTGAGGGSCSVGGASGSGGTSVGGTGGAAGSSTGGSGGATGGMSGTGGTALQFARVGPAAYYRSVECGPTACYALHRDITAANYRFIERLANAATALEDVSNGVGGSVASMLVDGADGLYVVQNGVGVFARAATASSFVMVGDPVTSLPTARHALARDGNGTLFAGTTTGVVALPSGGSTFAPVGCGLTFAYAVATDGTNLYAASNSVKVLRGGTGAWTDAGSNSPTSVNDVVFDRTGRLYAISRATGTSGFDAGVHRLAADGSAWQNVTGSLSLAAGFGNGVATNIVFDTQNFGYLVTETSGEPSGDTVVARLAPGGTQWTTMSAPGFPVGGFSCSWLAIDALDRLVAACGDGLFRSTPLR